MDPHHKAEKNIHKRIEDESLRDIIVRASYNLTISHLIDEFINRHHMDREVVAKACEIPVEDIDLYLNIDDIAWVAVDEKMDEIIIKMIEASYSDNEIIKITGCSPYRPQYLRQKITEKST